MVLRTQLRGQLFGGGCGRLSEWAGDATGRPVLSECHNECQDVRHYVLDGDRHSHARGHGAFFVAAAVLGRAGRSMLLVCVEISHHLPVAGEFSHQSNKISFFLLGC